MVTLVSIIIPVYNVEEYILRCATSLFRQTLENIEYIFVNDCTPDGSMKILRKLTEEYSSRKIKIITHEQNKGLPSARNTGLKAAAGEYIFHCDSDDWLEPDAMEKLYNAAKENNADIVWCDFYLSFRSNERYMKQAAGETPSDCIRAMLSGSMKFNVWNKLVRRSLYTEGGISFPDGYGMGEDMTMIKLFAFANRVVYLPAALYHYAQLNTNAFTKSDSVQKLEQIRHNVDDLVRFLHSRFGDSLNDEIAFFKLSTKLPFLITTRTESYRRWLEWYPEANAHIDKNPLFSRRTRMIQKAALKRQFWLLKLYYRLVIKVVYGLIYK